ncbi:NAD(P)-binding protein [Xylariomycetidae sp. FL0641]|nr:NAD(P)-binding protein [Xylariomycetidae sp. FL0641]
MATTQTDMSSLGAQDLFNVKGLVAVVTGGGTGIGLMITKALVANGAAKVYIMGRRLSTLQDAASSVDKDTVVPITCDVTSVDSLQAAAAQIGSEAGHVNLLVCNSGIGGPYGTKPEASMSAADFAAANLRVPPADFTQTFAVNASAVWYTAMAFLPLLEQGNQKDNIEQASQVVAVSSIAGFNKTNTGGYAYGQSKAACTHLVKQLSVVLPQWGIRANAICPGIYPSEMSTPILQRHGNMVSDQIPLKRTGDEKDMTGTILYLASRAGAYCNGAVIVSDGGRLTMFPSTF